MKPKAVTKYRKLSELHELPGNPNARVHFIKGRHKFGGAPHPAPFPSAIVIYTNWSQHDD